jgi:site-specific recombinase XerD
VSGDRGRLPTLIESTAPVTTPVLHSALAVPAMIAEAGTRAAKRFLEFFAASIENDNTWMAYYRAVCSFFAWLDEHGIGELADIEPFHVAATLTARPMHRIDVYQMVRRRTAEAGLKGKLGCHVFRATGITAYLEAGGTLENAQAMAAHESPRTTKLYDRTGDEITLDEVERINI